MKPKQLTEKFGLIDFETLTPQEAEKRMQAISGKSWCERVKETVAAAANAMSLPYEAVPA